MTTLRSTTAAQKGCVYLVGAGPGSVDLLTLRAHSLITTATCILHDDLVSTEILQLAAPNADLRDVGKRCGEKKITQEQINEWMIQFAREGHSVVRLKSGDPLLFGRAAEEIEALSQAEIPFEIVPGISAGFAASALAGLPLTGRITSSRVLFATRHLAAGATNGLEGIPPNLTLVLYMPGRDYTAIAAELIANGWPITTQCRVLSALGSTAQQVTQCQLYGLGNLAPLPAPTIMLFFAASESPVSTDAEPDPNSGL
jgi:uroporphyrin-III C-methyltransferase